MLIVETDKELEYLEKCITNQLIIAIPILSDNKKHYTNNRLSLLFISDFENHFLIPFNHSETLNQPLHVLQVLDKAKRIFIYDKKAFMQYYYNEETCFDIQLMQAYHRIALHDLEETVAHSIVYRYFYKAENINDIIPVVKHFDSCLNYLNKLDIRAFRRVNEHYLQYDRDTCISFNYIENKGLLVNYRSFVEVFNANGLENSIAKVCYNLHTVTGRPSNKFGGVNYAALNKTNGSRDAFLCKHDSFIQFDFESYHLRLLSKVVGYEFDSDIHTYLAKQFFSKEEISVDEREVSKQKAFGVVYGYSDEDFGIPFFKKVVEFKKALWSELKEKGYVESFLYKRKFTIRPASKLLNYYIQNLETERNVQIILLLKDLLKTYKTELVLTTYDSFLFDFSLEDGEELLVKIKETLEIGQFPCKVEIGTTYGSMRPIYL